MKGSILDLLPAMAMMFILSIVLLLCWTILDSFGTSASGVMNTSLVDTGKAGLELFNAGSLILLAGIGLAIILGGFLLQSHPAFAIIGILMLIVIVFVTAQFTNFYVTFTEETSLASAVGQFDLLTLLMKNLPLFFTVIGVVFIIVAFSKYYRGD